MPAHPDVSIIIAARNARPTIAACLESLRVQASDIPFEIIVVDSSTDGTAELIRTEFPEVKLFAYSTRKYCGDARNIAIAQSKADVVAFIDADCLAAENWLAEILKAHQTPYMAIGGAIGNANPESYVGWAAYFTEFSQWKPARKSRQMLDIAGASMTYKKEIFQTYGTFIEGTYCSDTEFHWRINEKGLKLLFAPSILIYHKNITALSKFLLHEFDHGRSFAKVRVKSRNFNIIKTLAYIMLSPAVAFKIVTKNIYTNIRNRKYFSQYLKAFPLTMLGIISWTLGECRGYIEHTFSQEI